MIAIPEYLYDVRGVIPYGTIRACGLLMRLRVEYLVGCPGGLVGLRRATHVASLIEVVYRSYEIGFNTGFFGKTLKERVEERLRAAEATLQPHEKHFADLEWWRELNRVEARAELESNIERLIADPPTLCLELGIELHALFDMRMRRASGRYESVITPERVSRSDPLRKSIERFGALMDAVAA